MIVASLSKKLKKYGFGNLKLNMHHTCAKNNPYSVLICHACRLSKTPSNSSFVPTTSNNTIFAKPKMTSEKTKTQKLQGEKKKAELRCHIRRMSGRQLDIKVKVQMLDDARMFPLKVLLNSGSTGSCISRKFVKENEI